MQSIEERIVARWPGWFAGAAGRWTRPLLRGLKRYTRIDQAEELIAALPHLSGLEFVEGALRRLDVRYRVDDLERQRIPVSGACLIVANHPLGALDALLLLKLVGDIRRDVLIVANDWLQILEPLRPLLLPVRVFGGANTPEHLNRIDAALEQGAAVIMFPAGEVSRASLAGVRDRGWRNGFLRYALRHRAPVIPVHVAAYNGFGFYAGAAIAGPLGSALLPRQIFSGRQRRVELRVAAPYLPAAAELDRGSVSSISARVQRAVESLRWGRDTLPARPEALAHGSHGGAIRSAVAGLQVLGETPDGKRILLLPPGGPSVVLRELARLRELTFRAVGEGTGQPLDWDRFDGWYDQLLLWDQPAQRIIGGYRVARSRDVIARHGWSGLYTASLFDFEPRFAPMLDAGLELGRSFVVPDYWGTRSLDYLWFGIGAYLRRHPELRYLFGTVSISAELPAPARDALVGYYQRYFGAETALARARHPYALAPSATPNAELTAEQAFRVLKDNLAQLGARVPTLYKQYTELCEPGGAQFLAFGVDAAFNNAVDGLILVDLARITARKRARYLESRPALDSISAQADAA